MVSDVSFGERFHLDMILITERESGAKHMKIKDLDSYNYSFFNKKIKSVGWLEGEFKQGEVPGGLIEKLKRYKKILPYMGTHECEYCENACGNGEIWVAAKSGQVYACPELVVHYIEEHHYLPPQEFIYAVLNGPAPNTEEYKEAIEKSRK